MDVPGSRGVGCVPRCRAPETRGTGTPRRGGAATEAGTALLDWAFATLDLNRVQGEADTRNPASRRVMEKLGFVHEGTLREECVVEGEVSDTWVLGLLRRDRERAAHRPRG